MKSEKQMNSFSAIKIIILVNRKPGEDRETRGNIAFPRRCVEEHVYCMSVSQETICFFFFLLSYAYITKCYASYYVTKASCGMHVNG